MADFWSDELRQRHGRIRAALAASASSEPGGCAALITCMANVIYASGRAADAYIYMPAEGEPTMFVRRPLGLRPDDVGGMEVKYISKPEQIPPLLEGAGIAAPRALLLEDAQLSYAETVRLLRAFGDAKLLPGGSRLMHGVRCVKTRFEAGRLRETCERLSEAFALIPELFRPGMADFELGRAMEQELCRVGHLGMIRVFGRSIELPSGGALLTGDNAANQGPYDFAISGSGRDRTMPAGGNGTPIAEGQTLMVDFGCNVNGYIGDMTRSFAVGEVPAEVRRAHAVAVEAQNLVARAAKPGAVCSELYGIALRHAESNGLGSHFMGYGQQSKFIGHGVGLELNELPIIAPKIDMRLEEGMAIALEPKFAFPGVGAVGIENTFLVAADGLTRLTIGSDDLGSLPA